MSSPADHRTAAAPRGRVYLWEPDRRRPLGGALRLALAPLPRLAGSGEALVGTHVAVRNAAVIHVPGDGGTLEPWPLGSATPDASGDFVFDPGRGGGRLDKGPGTPDFRERYVQSARFGEVNTYFHLDRIAAYVDGLLRELGVPSLPRVVAVVNAHPGIVECAPGVRDGRMLRGRWRPFQGGHYRLPSRRYDVAEHTALAATGEVHLGPGRKILRDGALVETSGTSYRANAAHNPGIIYHEYGHHITRHTADFRANSLREPDRQNNKKTAMDEGTCDYWTAVMLETPHIWACHRRHDARVVHPRSLVSPRTMDSFDHGPKADPHTNGTIWGAMLWELRERVAAAQGDGGRQADLIVLQALLLLGRAGLEEQGRTVSSVRRARRGFDAGLSALLAAEEALTRGRHRAAIEVCAAARGIATTADTVQGMRC